MAGMGRSWPAAQWAGSSRGRWPCVGLWQTLFVAGWAAETVVGRAPRKTQQGPVRPCETLQDPGDAHPGFTPSTIYMGRGGGADAPDAPDAQAPKRQAPTSIAVKPAMMMNKIRAICSRKTTLLKLAESLMPRNSNRPKMMTAAHAKKSGGAGGGRRAKMMTAAHTKKPGGAEREVCAQLCIPTTLGHKWCATGCAVLRPTQEQPPAAGGTVGVEATASCRRHYWRGGDRRLKVPLAPRATSKCRGCSRTQLRAAHPDAEDQPLHIPMLKIHHCTNIRPGSKLHSAARYPLKPLATAAAESVYSRMRSHAAILQGVAQRHEGMRRGTCAPVAPPLAPLAQPRDEGKDLCPSRPPRPLAPPRDEGKD
eukprot:350783-Chlamydomonas_euryale.AAC.1